MSDLQILMDRIKQRNGYPVSLRSIWPGRGKSAAQRRTAVAREFSLLKEDNRDGCEFDVRKGVYVLRAVAKVEAA